MAIFIINRDKDDDNDYEEILAIIKIFSKKIISRPEIITNQNKKIALGRLKTSKM
jgi:hypothetical protein